MPVGQADKTNSRQTSDDLHTCLPADAAPPSWPLSNVTEETGSEMSNEVKARSVKSGTLSTVYRIKINENVTVHQ